MNLRCMTSTHLKIILILLALVLLNACGQGGSEPSQTNDPQIVTTLSRDDDDDDDHHSDDSHHSEDDHHSDDGRHSDDDVIPGDGGGGPDGDGGGTGGGAFEGINIVAVHNPNSSQYNDNCLNCHGEIPSAQSLSSSIPNAHVAMLPFTPGEDSDQCVWCHRDVSNTLIHTMAQVGTFQVNIRKTVDTQLCAICHGPVGPGKPFYQTGLTTNADLDGSQLYHYLCSACHNELANSEVKNESAQEIYNAISENEGGMGPLNVLIPTWIQAIAVALGGDPTLPTDIPAPGTGTGDALYQQYCSGCHGALASSTKAGASAAQIQNGINTEADMNALSFLTAAQVQAIADALSGGGTGGAGGGGTGGTDGVSLYNQYCASCHNSLSNSEMAGASASQIQNGINNVGEMNSLSFLTSTQVQAIADALSGGGGGGGGGTPPPTTTDGAALYDQYCATCHSNLANSDQAGASSALIQNGINNVGEMNSLSFLTSTQVQAIADALSGGGGGGTGTGGTGGTDGASLYNQYCASCHNSLSNSEMAGASASLIQNGINNVGEMSSLGFLTSTQVQAIADALSGGGGGGTGGGGSGGTDGTSLYNQYCASCHGSLDDSEVRGESDSDIEHAIEENEGDMGSLDFLSEDQIEAIADVL